MSEAPRPPAHVAVYVEVLGLDLAIEFLLAFGGTELYLPANPQGNSAVEKLIGRAKTMALAARSSAIAARVPTAKPWLAQIFAWKGLSVVDIARKLHTTDVTVRKYLGKSRSDGRQLPLL